MNSRTSQYQRRGSASLSILILMMLAGLVVIGMVNGGARDQDLALRRAESVRAFYAAEAGMNMAIREMMLNSDEDGDGLVGSISADGIDANDPAFTGAQVFVTRADEDGQTILRSQGRSGAAHREIEARLE